MGLQPARGFQQQCRRAGEDRVSSVVMGADDTAPDGDGKSPAECL